MNLLNYAVAQDETRWEGDDPNTWWCDSCAPCYGYYYICDSATDSFLADLCYNCGPGSQIYVEYLDC